LTEAFETAGVTSAEEDMEELVKKVENAASKQANKFYSDERTNQKMTASQAKAYVEEFVENVMGALSNFLYEKPWFEKVSWNGVLLMLVFHTFENGKIFTRTLKSEVMQFIDDGILAWSEEERVVRSLWVGLETSGITENHYKKANQHLMKSYDEAHFSSPYSIESNGSLTPELAAVQEFVKGWMGIFASKGSNILENGLADANKATKVACLTALFQHLMDPNNPCLPLKLQPALPAAPWSFIEQSANEVIAEQDGEGGGLA